MRFTLTASLTGPKLFFLPTLHIRVYSLHIKQIPTSFTSSLAKRQKEHRKDARPKSFFILKLGRLGALAGVILIFSQSHFESRVATSSAGHRRSMTLGMGWGWGWGWRRGL